VESAELLPVIVSIIAIMADDISRALVWKAFSRLVKGHAANQWALLGVPLWQTMFYRHLYSMPFDSGLRNDSQEQILEILVDLTATLLHESMVVHSRGFEWTPSIVALQPTHVLGNTVFQLAAECGWDMQSCYFVNTLLKATVDQLTADVVAASEREFNPQRRGHDGGGVQHCKTKQDNQTNETADGRDESSVAPVNGMDAQLWESIGKLLRIVETFVMFRPWSTASSQQVR
jgi:hypothetical protein